LDKKLSEIILFLALCVGFGKREKLKKEANHTNVNVSLKAEEKAFLFQSLHGGLAHHGKSEFLLASNSVPHYFF
jgi:hypothetical protein